MYELSESRTMTPKTFAAVLSNMLYERRFGPFFINPVIAGLDPATKAPYITSMDLIGNMTEPEDFAVAGTCEDQLFGKILKLIINLRKFHEKNAFERLFSKIDYCLESASSRVLWSS
jgi:hypothetical protein